MSTVVTPAEIKTLAPELAGESDERVQLFIDISREKLSERAWGTKYKRATQLLAAHALTLAKRQTETGQAGSVTSERVGDLARSYADAATSAKSEQMKSLMQTGYGQMYYELLMSLGISPRVTGC